MRKASTRLLEQGIQAPSPAPDLIPAETSTENLHWDRYIGRGHFTWMYSGILAFASTPRETSLFIGDALRDFLDPHSLIEAGL
jgi:hypothetical protein